MFFGMQKKGSEGLWYIYFAGVFDKFPESIYKNLQRFVEKIIHN
jgi:hypothetical protein